MSRTFWLPTARSFSLSGTARISALIPDNVIDTLLGGPDVFGGAVIGSNERLPGDLNARAVFAFDGSTKTFWSPGFDGPAQIGAWMQASLNHSVSFDHLDLKVIADGRHSVPTRIRITTNTGGDELVPVPPVRDRKAIDSVVSVPVELPDADGEHDQVHGRGRSQSHDHQLVHTEADRHAGRDRRDRASRSPLHT